MYILLAVLGPGLTGWGLRHKPVRSSSFTFVFITMQTSLDLQDSDLALVVLSVQEGVFYQERMKGSWWS